MGRVLSFGLERVLEHFSVTSVVRRKSRTQTDSGGRVLGTGQRRILEHVVTTTTPKRLKMPH
jgi:hypothetical protein